MRLIDMHMWISHDMTHWHVTWLIHMNVTCEKVTTDKVFGELWIMRGLFAAKVSCLHMSPVAINKPYYLRTCHFTWVFGWLTHMKHGSRICYVSTCHFTWGFGAEHSRLHMNESSRNKHAMLRESIPMWKSSRTMAKLGSKYPCERTCAQVIWHAVK